MKVLALDIGGTNFRLAIIDFPSVEIVKIAILPTNIIKRPAHVINDFISGFRIEKAGIGFAGPIIGKTAQLTNGDLRFDVTRLERETGLEITLMNDFEAIGHGIKYMKKKTVFNRKRTKNKRKIVIGAGTGLGTSLILGQKIISCEGGHMSIGTGSDYKLVKSLKAKYYEDIVSGRGIERLGKHYLGSKVSSYEITKNYKKYNRIMNQFVKFYARFAKDCALMFLPSEIYLSGGISPTIRTFKKQFMKEFTRHSNYKHILEKIGVYIVTEPNIGLIGAGAAVIS